MVQTAELVEIDTTATSATAISPAPQAIEVTQDEETMEAPEVAEGQRPIPASEAPRVVSAQATPYAIDATTAANTLAAPLTTDSLVADSLTAGPAVYGLVLEPPAPPAQAPLRQNENLGVSFILGSLFILLLVIALRFRDNIRYVGTMLHDLLETRTRHNIFDDTVRETSLIFLLNILWCASAGITGFCFFRFVVPGSIHDPRAIGMLWGMALATVYSLFMWGTYGAVGWVFGDASRSRLWVKGFSMSQALMAPAFFLAALAAICRPEASPAAAAACAAVFIMAKLAFIWKGYRIFFTQFSSWVLFLCYLCSLEIVPLILCYRMAILLGNTL